MNKTKIVLFAPSPEYNYYWTRAPLSLIAASSLVYTAGIKVTIITARDYDWRTQVLKETKDALLFGITTMTGYQIYEGLIAAKIVKDANPQVPVVFGGWHPTILPKQTCEHPLVDIVVKGQGERTLFELTKCLLSNSDISSVKGIVFKKGKQIIETEDRHLEDINNFPSYPYNLVDCKKYSYKTEYGERTLNYISSVGCPHRCSFCAEPVVHRRRWLALNAERVVEDWERLVKEYNIDGINVDDNNFFVDKSRVVKICEGLLKKKLKIKWGWVNAHARDILKYEDEIWKLMKASGLYGLLVGAESGLNEALQYLNKDATVEDTVRLGEKLAKYNITLGLSLMVGLPQSDCYRTSIDKEITSILELVWKCYNISKNIGCRVFFYTPYPGSLLYKEALKMGLKEPTSLNKWAEFNLNYPHLPNVSKRHVQVVNSINFSMGCMRTRFTKTREFEGYRIIKGKNMIRKIVWNLIDYVGYLIACFRWKYKYFRYPLEYYFTQYIVKIKEEWDIFSKK